MGDGVKQMVIEFLSSKGDIPGETKAEKLAYLYLDEGLVDSMGIVDMVMTLEDKLDMRFEPQPYAVSRLSHCGWFDRADRTDPC